MQLVDYVHEIFNENTTTALMAIMKMSKEDIHVIRHELKQNDHEANEAAKKVGAVLNRNILETLAFSPSDINGYIRARNAAGVKFNQNGE